MEIAKRIKQIRLEKGLSQNDVALGIGVDISSISYWESGTYEPKAIYIYKLAKYFDVTSDYLLGLEDESGRKIYNTVSNHIADNHGTINQTNNFN